VPCAVPAEQTSIVRDQIDDTRAIALWPAAGGEEPDAAHAETVFLHVHTNGGRRRLACSRIRVRSVSRDQTVRLSPLLRRALSAFPHVVGLTYVEDELLWLVDLGGFREP
jgi:hypothetical protein